MIDAVPRSRLPDALLLLVAIACEVTATTLLKGSDGLTRAWHVAGVGIGYIVSVVLLTQVLKRLPVGPVYASWAGLGTAGAAAVGLTAFGERLPVGGWFGVGLVVTGVTLLGLYAPHDD
jgi:small multidrug resistance pump